MKARFILAEIRIQFDSFEIVVSKNFMACSNSGNTFYMTYNLINGHQAMCARSDIANLNEVEIDALDSSLCNS